MDDQPRDTNAQPEQLKAYEPPRVLEDQPLEAAALACPVPGECDGTPS